MRSIEFLHPPNRRESWIQKTKQRIAPALLMSLLAGLSSCAAGRISFIPVEQDSGLREGYRDTTVYYFGSKQANDYLNIRVWTDGVRESVEALLADPRTDLGIQINVFIYNNRNPQAVFDYRKALLFIDSKQGRRYGPLRPAPDDPYYLEEFVRIPSRSNGSFLLFFLLPEGLQHVDIQSFELNWTVESGETEFKETTAFIRVPGS